MSEATTIDRLSIEITSSSNGAAQSIDALATSLGKLKTNGSVGVAVKNLNNLTAALRGMTSVASGATTLSTLAKSVTELSEAGSITKVVNQLGKLPGAVKALSGLSIDDGLFEKASRLASALEPLTSIKSGGLGTMVNSLAKIGKVTDSLDDDTIGRFAERVSKLNNELAPLATKMTTIQAGLRGINSSAKSASSSMSAFDGKVKTTRLNLANLITVLYGVKAAIMPLVYALSSVISEAIEWDGIAARFGRGFGPQAQEVYTWIQRLNREMGINTQEFMQYSSTYASMLTGFGVPQEDAAKMALGYMELTYDAWAGYNDIYKRLEDSAEAIRSAIAGEVEPIRRMGLTITEATLQETAANHGLTISLQDATEAQKSYLRYLAITDAAHAQGLVGTYAAEMNTAEGAMRSFTQALKSLAQSLGSLLIPALSAVIPWVIAFVNVVTAAIRVIAGFFGITIGSIDWSGFGAGVSGGAGALDDMTGSAEDATGALEDTGGAAGSAKKAIEDLKRATLGIDELNVISPPQENKGGGGGGGGGGADLSGMFDALDIDSLWDEAIFDQIQFKVDEIEKMLIEGLKHLTAVVSGFALAIGTILVVSGANIPLGLALMVAGAAGLVAVIAANWNGMSEQLAKTLTTVTAVLGGFLLAIGAFLAFSGVNVGLGAALMVAGAVSLGTALTINWKFLNGDMENALSILTGIVSGGLLALGALFAFTGVSTGLGIALMVAGAVGLATAVGLNWDAMSEPLRKAIGTLEMIVGTAMLSFGAILAFSGANIPLGLALIAAGAVSIVAAEQLNWNSLNGTMKNKIATITTLVSGAVLGLGAVLAFSGVALPLGIALMAAGAVGIVASAPVNWKSLVSGIKTVLKEVGAAIGGALLAVGAVLALSGVALPLGISLMAAGAVSLVSAVALNWDSVVNSVKNTLKKIGIAAGGAMLAMGLILCLSGVGIPAGIAMMAAGGASLVSGVALNWDSILNNLKKAWKKVEEWWRGIKELDPVGVAVSLVKKGWTTVVGWIGKIPGVSQAVKLIKSGWSTVKGWVGSIPTLSQSIKLIKSGWSSVKKWVGSIPMVSQGVGLVKKGWTSVKKWVGTMPTLSAGIKLVKSGWSSVKSWLGSLNYKLSFTLPKIGINWGTKTFAGFKISYPKGFYTYAKGGFPDMGELFVAREAGPEMVGKIGSKTTVANNQQIVEGISEGVYAAVLAAMKASEGNGSQSVNVYLDGRQITSSVEKRQRERGASIMGREVYAY